MAAWAPEPQFARQTQRCPIVQVRIDGPIGCQVDRLYSSGRRFKVDEDAIGIACGPLQTALAAQLPDGDLGIGGWDQGAEGEYGKEAHAQEFSNFSIELSTYPIL